MSNPLGDDISKAIYNSTRKKVESLWYASEEGDVKHVKEIIDAGNHDVNGLNYWQVDIDPRGWQRTPLHTAALNGRLEVAKFLISKGANVNALTKYLDTPLHFAVAQGHADVARLLLERGADLHAKNDDGDTPLDLAEKSRDQEMIAVFEKRRK